MAILYYLWMTNLLIIFALPCCSKDCNKIDKSMSDMMYRNTVLYTVLYKSSSLEVSMNFVNIIIIIIIIIIIFIRYFWPKSLQNLRLLGI